MLQGGSDSLFFYLRNPEITRYPGFPRCKTVMFYSCNFVFLFFFFGSSSSTLSLVTSYQLFLHTSTSDAHDNVRAVWFGPFTHLLFTQTFHSGRFSAGDELSWQVMQGRGWGGVFVKSFKRQVMIKKVCCRNHCVFITTGWDQQMRLPDDLFFLVM